MCIRDRDGNIADLETGGNIGKIYKNRSSARKRRGGGVAILYHKHRCLFKERKIKGNHFELVCGVAKLRHNTRPCAVIVLYIPPDSAAAEYHAALEAVSNEILKLKTELNDPYIILGGDLNRRKVEEATGAFPDMGELDTEPTRGHEKLDIISTNFCDEIVSVEVREPLTSEEGISSDHKVVIAKASLNHSHRFSWRRFKSRKITKEGEEKFGFLLAKEDWRDVYSLGPSEAAELLAQKLDTFTNECFPEKHHKIKSTDDPWISRGIRKKIEAGKRIF